MALRFPAIVVFGFFFKHIFHALTMIL